MFINVFSESNLLCCTRSVLKVMVMRRPWTTANVYKSKVNISLLYLCTVIILVRCHFSKKVLRTRKTCHGITEEQGKNTEQQNGCNERSLSFHFFGLDFQKSKLLRATDFYFGHKELLNGAFHMSHAATKCLFLFCHIISNN